MDGKEKPRCVIAEFPKMEIWQLGWKEQTKQNDVIRFHEFSMKAVSVTVQTKRPRFRKQKITGQSGRTENNRSCLKVNVGSRT